MDIQQQPTPKTQQQASPNNQQQYLSNTEQTQPKHPIADQKGSTASGKSTYNSKRTKSFILNDNDRQLAEARAEIARLENINKEQEQTIRQLRLQILTKTPGDMQAQLATDTTIASNLHTHIDSRANTGHGFRATSRKEYGTELETKEHTEKEATEKEQDKKQTEPADQQGKQYPRGSYPATISAVSCTTGPTTQHSSSSITTIPANQEAEHDLPPSITTDVYGHEPEKYNNKPLYSQRTNSSHNVIHNNLPNSSITTFGTLNCQNVKSNCIYIKEALRKVDILCLQEHWLFNFEQHELDKLFPHHRYAIKSSEDEDPITPEERKRGYGGVAILWNVDVDPSITTLKDGSARTIAVSMTMNNSSRYCIINTYMPCRGKVSSEKTFRETLDELREIIIKYKPTHRIILCGDFNSSINRQNPNRHDLLLQDFLESNGLHQGTIDTAKPTLYHHDGKSTAQIDYIFTESDSSLRSTTTIHDMSPINTSDHILATTGISGYTVQEPMTKHVTCNLITKPKWHKCNVDAYTAFINTHLCLDGIDWDNITNYDLSVIIKHLNEVMRAAEKHSIKQGKCRKRKGYPWTPAIATASERAKAAHIRWRDNGKPTEPENELFQERKESKKYLRQQIRQHFAEERYQLYGKIMQASEYDNKLFHQLIARQRHSVLCNTDTLELDGKLLIQHDELVEGWKVHFERLATPVQKSHFDDNFKNQVEAEVLMLDWMYNSTKPSFPSLTEDELVLAINKLNNNKAADSMGITAEHIKLGGSKLLEIMTNILNVIIKKRSLPNVLKEGILTPVLKKGKDKTKPGNYRGITVTSTISKVLEAAMQPRIEPTILQQQNRLQRGFTPKTTPNFAALIVTELINETKDTNKTLALVTLDSEKAFDVVWHDGLMRKLGLLNIHGDLWLIIKDLQTNGTAQIKWNGTLSTPYLVEQGIKQGAKLSPSLYKCYNNDLLNTLEKHNIGASIGSIFIGSPTVADNIALLADNPLDLQTGMNTVHHFSAKNRFTINSLKSDVVIFNQTKDRECANWKLDQNILKETSSTVHLGITRSATKSQIAEERVSKGRRTIYALMGAGLHVTNGLNPVASSKLYITYVRPRMTYGLEVTSITQSDLKTLQTAELKLLRQIQSLPDRCANTATYILLGITPIDIQIEMNALSVFGSILLQPGTVEHELARRQLTIKDEKTQSWFIQIRRILSKYDLPSAFELLERPPAKPIWKKKVKEAVCRYWSIQCKKDIECKPSLRFISIQDKPTSNPHPVWKYAVNNPREAKKAAVKAKILTGTYTLQANKAKFNQHLVKPNCKLCSTGPENREHFLLHCPFLQPQRQKHVNKIINIIKSCIITKEVRADRNCAASSEITHDHLLQCILDCTALNINTVTFSKQQVADIERLSRNMLFDLHISRTRALNNVQLQ